MEFNTQLIASDRFEGGFAPYVPAKHVPQYKKLLPNYKPSPEHSLRISRYMRDVGYVGAIGAASSGKNALISTALEIEPDIFTLLLSVTSRPKRRNNGVWEEEGENYYYRTHGEIINMLSEGEFIEAALINKSQVSGQHVDHLQKAYRSKKIVLNEFEIAGAVQLRRIEPTWRGMTIVPDDPQLHQEVFAKRSGVPAGEMDDDMLTRNKTAIWELDGILREREGYAPFVNRFVRSDNQEDIQASMAENAERFVRVAKQAKNRYEGHFDPSDFEHIANMRDFLIEHTGVSIEQINEERGHGNVLVAA